MMSKNLRRGLVALATTLVCVASMASPAPAATLSGTITDGSVTLHNSTSTVSETLSSSTGGSGTGVGCGTTGAVELTSTTARVTTISSTVRFIMGTGHYVAVLTLLASTAGALSNVTTTSADFSSSTVTLRADLFVATNTSSTATDCAHGTTRTCRYTATLHLNGTYTGNEANPAISDTAVVNAPAANLSVAPPCSTPFSTFIGGTATVNGLTLHVTTVT